MSPQTKALIFSFLRVLAGCAVAAVSAISTAKGYGPLNFTSSDWASVANSIIGAVLVTVTNYFRKGETRFGINAVGDPPGRHEALD